MARPPGPEPAKISEIIRWQVKPGDRLVVLCEQSYVSEDQVAEVKQRLRIALQLPEDFPIAVASREWSFSVLSDSD